MIRCMLLLLVLWTAPLLGQSDHMSHTEDLQFLIIEALTKNPEIAAQGYRMEVYENKVPQMGALDDPQLTLRWMEIPGTRFNQAMYANLELMQMIRFPTKLSTERSMAVIQAEHAHHDHLETILDVVLRVKTSHAMLWYARTALVLNRENQRLLQQILSTATTQYSVGRASQQDVLKTSIELERLKADEASLLQDIVAAESMLRSLLNRRPSETIGDLDSLELEPVDHDLPDVLAYALQNRPMIVHDSLSIAESKLMLSLQKQEYIPDFKVGVEYVTSPLMGSRSWSVMAGISVPIAPWTLRKASARVQEATAERSMRESMFTASQRMLEAQITEQYARVKALEVRVRSFDSTIIPQTEQSLLALLTEYQTGRTSYLMLLDTFRMYQMTRMEAAMSLMEYHQRVAALERAVGVTTLNVIPKEN